MTAPAAFPVAPGQTVTAWDLGPLEAEFFPGPVTQGVDNVDYVFINGFVDVGDLPCRRAVLDDIAMRDRPALEPFVSVALNLPGFDRKLDFSGFWHTPHRLRRWVRTRLVPPSAGDQPFALATCGGVHVWVDGALITRFEPYTRNIAQRVQLDLPLRADGSDVVILMEDMAERDTNFFVELTWCGAEPLQAELPTTANPKALPALMDAARSIRPAQVVFDGTGSLKLLLDQPASMAMTLVVEVRQSVHLNHLAPLFHAQVKIEKGDIQIIPGDLGDLPDAYHPLDLTFHAGAAKVSRRIAFARLRQPEPRALSATLSARKAEALAHACEAGEPRMGWVLALLGAGRPLYPAAKAALRDTLDGIEMRRDCSDFEMVPLLWAMGAYADQIPDDLRDRAKAAILNYRYWLDEPGNDTMWFWSENHVLCFHVSQYLAGRFYPDALFTNSGLIGTEMAALAATRMARWYDSVEAHGFAEWNSAAYYPIDFIGLLAMHHGADGALKNRATQLLDQLFLMIGLHTLAGVPSGSMGRAYDKELRAGPLNELAPMAAVAFGQGWLNSGVACLPQFCLSDYAPPPAACSYVSPDQPITAHYVQGHGAAARLALHKSAHVQLSAAVDGLPGQTGHQQHLLDVQFAARPFARVWVNHPGDDDPWGGKRPSFWAGNGILPRIGMTGRRALILSNLPADADLPFTHAYAPLDQFDLVQRGPDWMVLRAGEGAVLLKATGQINTTSSGPGAGIEHHLTGHRSGWAIVTADGEAGTQLADRAAAMSLTWDGTRLHLTDPHHTTLSLDPLAGLFADGQSVPFPSTQTQPQVTYTKAHTAQNETTL